MTKSFNVLFLCTGNSARSILAEALLNHLGAGRFQAFSAGSFPKGAVHPMSLQLLRSLGLPVDGFRSKSWHEFTAPGAPVMDLVVTVCDQAAGEVCPFWPGGPMAAHWGVPDPAAATGSELERMAAFREAFGALEHRIRRFIDLPIGQMDRVSLKRAVDEIGGSSSDAPAAEAL